MNIDNFNAVLAHIEQHPREHNQDWYRDENPCGTTYCFIGRAAVMGAGHYNVVDCQRDACGFLGIGRGGQEFWWISTTERTVDDFRRLRWMLATSQLIAHAV